MSFVFTGIFIFLGPRLVLLPAASSALRGAWGEFYCRALSDYTIILLFGKASNLTLMCLAIERWFAFVRPIRYKVAFTRPRMLKYLAVIWVLSVASRAFSIFTRQSYEPGCVIDQQLRSDKAQYLAVVHVLATFVLPVAVTWGTFAHLWQKLRRSVNSAQPGVMSREAARRRLLRMCVLAALCLTVCWLPFECSFLLLNFKIIDKTKNLVDVGLVLATFNSCVNPLLYYFSNQEYKSEFVRVFCSWRQVGRIEPVQRSGPAVVHARTRRNSGEGRVSKNEA